MIANAYYNRSLRSPIEYNERKVEEGTAILLLSSGQVAEGRSTEERIRIMESLIPESKCVLQPATHIYICPHPGDRLNESRYRSLAELFIRLMHYDRQSVLVYLHADILRDHMHVVTSAYDDNGIHVRKQRERGIIKGIIPEIERELGLYTQRVDLGAIPPLPHNVVLPRSAPEIGYTSIQIAVALATVTSRFRFFDLDGLDAILRVYGFAINAYESPCGKRGILYRIDGKLHARRVKASAFWQRFDLRTVEQLMRRNKECGTGILDVEKMVRLALERCEGKFRTFCSSLDEAEITVLPSWIHGLRNKALSLTFLDRRRMEVHSAASLGIARLESPRDTFGDAVLKHSFPQATTTGTAEWSAILRSVLSSQGIPMSRHLEHDVTITDVVTIRREHEQRWGNGTNLRSDREVKVPTKSDMQQT